MKRYPGKFEACTDQRLGEALYRVVGNGGAHQEWSPPNDGIVDWYGLVLSHKYAYIVHEDNQGFWYYDAFPKPDGIAKWEELVIELDTDYSEETL